MKELNDNNFKEELEQSKLVLVDFYATWCGPCGIQSGILEKMNNSRSLKFEIMKVNVDNAPRLAMEYRIESIPTLMIFKDNILVKKIVGLSEEEEILAMMEEFED